MYGDVIKLGDTVYTVLKRIKSNNYNTVFVIVDNNTGNKYLYKKTVCSEKVRSHILEIYRSLICVDNVVNFYKMFSTPVDIANGNDTANGNAMVEFTTLFNFIETKDMYENRATNQIDRDIVLQLIKTVAMIHDQGIAHCDIKPQNMLLKDNTVYIIDFEHSIFVNKDVKDVTHSRAGTPHFLAPEMIDYLFYSGKQPDIDFRLIDIYSLGVTIYMLYNYVPPYDFTTVSQLVNRAIRRKYRLKTTGDITIDTVIKKCMLHHILRPTAWELYNELLIGIIKENKL